MCYSVLQCVAVRRSTVQCVADPVFTCVVFDDGRVLQCAADCCRVLQYVAGVAARYRARLIL